MPSRSEVLGDETIGGEEPLRMSWGLKALQAPLALVGGLMGVLRQVRLIARLGAAVTSLIGIVLAEFPAPLPDRLVGDDDSSGEQQLFDITVAEAETEVEPDAVTDDLGWKSMVLVRVG
jgi:hypothetical protein